MFIVLSFSKHLALSLSIYIYIYHCHVFFSRSSIFGSAKPVDTASREREIDEKLNRQKDEEIRSDRTQQDRRRK